MSYSNKFDPLAYGEIESILAIITPFPSAKEFDFPFSSSERAGKAKSLLYDWRNHHRKGDTFPFKIFSLHYSPGFRIVFPAPPEAPQVEEREILPQKSDTVQLNAIVRNLIGVKNPFTLLGTLFLENRIVLREAIYILQQLVKAISQDNPFTPSKDHLLKAVLEAGKGLGLSAEKNTNTSTVRKSNIPRTVEGKEKEDAQ